MSTQNLTTGLSAARAQRYQAIFESAVDFAIIVSDRDGQVTDWNPGAERIFGWTGAEMEGEHAARLFTPEDRAEGWPMMEMRRALDAGRASDERWHLRKDGTRFWASAEMHPLQNRDGAYVGFLKILRDRTEQTREREEARATLRESEARFRGTFQQAAVGVSHVSLDSRWLRVNERLSAMLGYTEAELLDKTFQDVTHPDDVEEDVENVHRLLSGDINTYSMEKRYIRKDGTPLWVNLTVSLLHDEAGTPQNFISIVEDVSARKAAEAALAESEALKGSVLEAALDCIITIDRNGNIVEWNPAAERTFGLARDAALGRRVGELIIPPEHRAAHVRGLAHYLATGEGPLLGRRIEVEAMRADGSRFPAEIAITPTSAGGRTLFTAHLRNITNRNRAAVALRESEARLRDLLATLDLGAFMVSDLDGTIRFWSQGCEQLYGWTTGQAVGYSAHELLRTVFPASLPEIEADLLRDGAWTGDLVQRRRDGTKITVAARKVLRRDADRAPVALAESVADVTVLRATQAELQRLNEGLEARVREEVAAREAAQGRLVQAEKMTALGQLAGGIAHDFNNILQAAQGGAALIRRHAADPASVQRLAQMVEDAARRGASVTRRLLAFARRDELRAEPIEVPALLDGIHEVLEHCLGGVITVRLDLAPGLPRVLADRSQLETVLVNLATNARDAMPGGGTLTFSASVASLEDEAQPAELVPGTYIRLIVTDTGMGMDAATLVRAFEPFFTTKPQGQGTGLGLPMARGFAEQSGGVLTISSERGRGTSVGLWLPAANAGVAASGSIRKEAPAAPTARGAPRILLVDDEDLVRDVIAEELEDCGYDVLQANEGVLALKLLDAGEAVDVLVSDLAMPHMDGVALIRAAQNRRPRLPAVLLTGYAGESAALAVGEAVGRSFTLLRKPIGGADLADRLAMLLEAGAAR
jgi:hypothetical protein